MRLAGPAALVLVTTALVSGCGGSGASCDDVPHLQAELAKTSPSDPHYNDIVVELKQARADCATQ